MKAHCKVVLIGNSLLMAGVEASLAGWPGMDVWRINATRPDAAERLNTLRPDVVIFDLTAPNPLFSDPHLSVSILQKHPGISLIGLDPNSNNALVFSGQEQMVLAANDLAQAIRSLVG